MTQYYVIFRCWYTFCFCLGTCWPPLWRPESIEFLLGGWRFHIQVLWGHPGRSFPQGNQAQSRYPMDHKASSQTQRDAWADLCWQEKPWPWQGPQIPSHNWWLTPCCLETTQHLAAAPLPLIFFAYRFLTIIKSARCLGFTLSCVFIKWRLETSKINICWLQIASSFLVDEKAHLHSSLRNKSLQCQQLSCSCFFRIFLWIMCQLWRGKCILGCLIIALRSIE